MSVISHARYSQSNFILATKNKKIKEGDAVIVTTSKGNTLTLPYKTIFSDKLKTDYIDTQLFESIIQENGLQHCFHIIKPEKMCPFMAFQVESLAIDLKQIAWVTHIQVSFANLRKGMMHSCLLQSIPKPLIEIMKGYLPTKDAPDSYTAEECLALYRKQAALGDSLRNERNREIVLAAMHNEVEQWAEQL